MSRLCMLRTQHVRDYCYETREYCHSRVDALQARRLSYSLKHSLQYIHLLDLEVNGPCAPAYKKPVRPQILDFFLITTTHTTSTTSTSTIMATKSTLRTDAPEFRMMLCGKHVSPPNILEHSGFRLESRKELYFRPLLPGEKHGECLCDYYGFPELLQERTQVSSEVEVS